MRDSLSRNKFSNFPSNPLAKVVCQKKEALDCLNMLKIKMFQKRLSFSKWWN